MPNQHPFVERALQHETWNYLLNEGREDGGEHEDVEDGVARDGFSESSWAPAPRDRYACVGKSRYLAWACGTEGLKIK